MSTVLAFVSAAVTVVPMLWLRRIAVPLLACAVLAVLPVPSVLAGDDPPAPAPGGGALVTDADKGPVNSITVPSEGDGSSLVVCDKKTGQGIYVPTGEVLYDENWCTGVQADWVECLTGYDVWRFYGNRGAPVKFASMSRASLREWCLGGRASRVSLFFPNPWDERTAWPEGLNYNGPDRRGYPTNGVDTSSPAGSGATWLSPWSINKPAERMGAETPRDDRLVGSFTDLSNQCLQRPSLGGVLGKPWVVDVFNTRCVPTTGQIIAKWPAKGATDCKVALPEPEARLTSALDPESSRVGLASTSAAVSDGLAAVALQARSLLKETYFAVRRVVTGGARQSATITDRDPLAEISAAEKFALGWLGYDINMTSPRPFADLNDGPDNKIVPLTGIPGTFSKLIEFPDSTGGTRGSCASPLNYMRFPLVDPDGKVTKEWSPTDDTNPLLGMCVVQRARPMWRTVKPNVFTGWVELSPTQALSGSNWPGKVRDLVGDRYSENKVNINANEFINNSIKVKGGSSATARAAAQSNSVTEITKKNRPEVWSEYTSAIKEMLTSAFVKNGLYSGPGGDWFPNAEDVRDVSLTPFVGSKARETMDLDSAMETINRAARCFISSPTPGKLSESGLLVTKTANPGEFSGPGQAVTYTITALNQGTTPLSGVKVEDPKVALTCTPALPATLAPGARVSCSGVYRTTQADVTAGMVTNTASASGTTSAGVTVSGSDSSVIVLKPAPPPPPPTPGPTPSPTGGPGGVVLNGTSGDVTVYVQMDSAFSAQGGYSPRSARVTGVSQPVCRESDPRICPTLIWVKGGLRLSHQNFSTTGPGASSYRRCASPSSRACDYYVYDASTRSSTLPSPSSNVLGQQVSGLFFSPTPPGVQVVAAFEGLNGLVQTYYLEPTYTTYTYPCGTEEEPATCSFQVLNPQSMWIVRNGPQVPLSASQIAVIPSGGSGSLSRRVFGSVG